MESGVYNRTSRATFIRDARSVTSDPQVEHQTLNALLAHSRGAADRFLDAYFHSDEFAHNPFKIAEKKTVSVQIDSILQLSAHSYQVRWTELEHALNGIAIGAQLLRGLGMFGIAHQFIEPEVAGLMH